MFSILKQLSKSKTIVVSVLTVALGVIGYLAGHEVIAAHPEWVAGLITVSGVVQFLLRMVTVMPVWEK